MDELGSTAAAAGKSDESAAERFGRLLREELELAGLPTYQNIANRGGISKSAVSDAMRGVRIPSARTVLGIMAGLDRDPEPLLLERERLQRPEVTDTPAPTHDPSPRSEIPKPEFRSGAADVSARHRVPDETLLIGPQTSIPVDSSGNARGNGRPRWQLSGMMVSILAGVLLVGVVAGYFATVAIAAVDGGNDRSAATGSIVLDTPCTKDGIVVASERRAGDIQLEIVFSHDCEAMWGRVLRNDGRAFGNGMEAVFYPKGDPESELAQRVEVQDTSTALTAMVVQAEKTRQFCLEATLTLDGGRMDLGDPLCL